MDCSPLGSSVHGISQARILEWTAISSSKLMSSYHLKWLKKSGTEPDLGLPWVAQWLRIHRLMQETQVQSRALSCPRVARQLSRCTATQPASRALEPQSQSPCAATSEVCPKACAPKHEKPPQGEAHASQWRAVPAYHNEKRWHLATKTQHS